MALEIFVRNNTGSYANYRQQPGKKSWILELSDLFSSYCINLETNLNLIYTHNFFILETIIAIVS